MKLQRIWLHARWMTLELLRQPTYLVSTLAFPALFYLIFAVPESKERATANFLMASFSGFAVFGVIFLQFGVGLAQERTQSWHQYLKTLPIHPLAFLLARFVSSFIFALMTALVIVALALTLTPAQLNSRAWLEFFLALLGGGFAFCFLGIALGFWSNEKTSLPLGNLIYLPLTFAGGLWKPPALLPESIRSVSEYLPTRFYGEILWAVVQGQNVASKYAWGLFGYALLFSIVAAWGYRRDLDYRVRG